MTTCAWWARSPTQTGLPVWELSTRAPDLEQLFFDLTSGGNRNLGDPAVPTDEGVA